MNSLLSRLIKRYKMTIKNWKDDCQFSKKLALYRLAGDLGGRAHLQHISSWGNSSKDKWILEYLQEKVQDIIDKYKNQEYAEEADLNAPIWICWWTGEETAPMLVKQCIRSIRNNAGNHPVHMITKDNYSDFVDIPDYILTKVESGKMCIANFSDYLRAALIATYGGLWIDATVFCTDKIPSLCFELPIFTLKSPYAPNGYLSKGRWTSFCIGGWKKEAFFCFFKEALEVYWKDEEISIDYLLVDYIIEIAYSNLPQVKRKMDEIPINNIHRDELQAAMNHRLPAEEFWNIIQDDTVFYKLSWRETYSEETLDKRKSVYSYFLNM